MKIFLIGLFVLPALIGTVVIFHTLIDNKEITNRIARTELVWLAASRPEMFCETMPWMCMDVKEKHEER